MRRIQLVILATVGLLACDGGLFKKKNCKTCETLTYNPQSTEPSRIVNRVCGDEVEPFIIANTFSTSSLSVVTTCK
ncbi:hypothetical protein [Spirosoma agri]|uniref:Uncharacterized protein n=1 Tax=Spirosoma agri TaxID=1987381 RepID=A0A6M0IHY8_9BACT|nr:hypothetical protein [Spirosoma agri]NEU66941.1 hypothetical protein [Spirosoma agri]